MGRPFAKYWSYLWILASFMARIVENSLSTKTKTFFMGLISHFMKNRKKNNITFDVGCWVPFGTHFESLNISSLWNCLIIILSSFSGFLGPRKLAAKTNPLQIFTSLISGKRFLTLRCLYIFLGFLFLLNFVYIFP